MRWFDSLWARAKLLFGRRAAESRMEDEFRFHVEMETAANIRRGLAPAEARRCALASFGGVERHKETMRAERGARPVTDTVRDATYALRALHRSPAFALVTVLTLGVGTGSVAAMFALVNSIVLRPLPYPDSDRLVALAHAAPGLGLAETGLSSGTFFHYRDNARSFEAIELYTEGVVNLSGGDTAGERVAIAMVGPGFFQVLGVSPTLGRTFTLEEVASQDGMNLTGTVPVLLSHDLWTRRYGADPDIVGRVVDVNTRPREVIGVMPPGFSFPRPTTDIWLLAVTPVVTADFAASLGYDAIARLRPGVSREEAEAELSRILPTIEGAYPDATSTRLAEVRLRPIVVPLKQRIVGDVGASLWILLTGMSLVLLVACANVASLVLGRAHRRAKEIAVRAALGARSAELVRLQLSESAWIAVGGTALGLWVGSSAISLLSKLTTLSLPRMAEVRLDGRTLILASVMAAGIALGIACVSMLRHAGARHLSTTLRGTGRTTTADAGSLRWRGFLVAAQVAMALTLLVGSALMIRSYDRLMSVDRGFDAEGVLVVDTGLPFSRSGQHVAILNDLMDRVRAIPGVTSVGGISELPLAESVWTASLTYPVRVSDRAPTPEEVARPVALRFFLPGYFEAMHTRVLEGVGLASEGETGSPHPVVISKALADRLFPARSAVGERIRRLSSEGTEEVRRGPSGESLAQPDYTIVGVVANVSTESLRAAPAEIVYIPVLEPRVDPAFIPTEMTLVIRSDVPPQTLASAARDAVRETDPVMGVGRTIPLAAIVRTAAARESLLAGLLLVGGVAALFLGAVGIYAAVSDAVRYRRREIALRMALGARAEDVVNMVLVGSIRVVLFGVAVGLGVSVSSARVLRSFLYSVGPFDPLALALAVVFILTVAIAASLIPALRGARLSPIRVLGEE